VTKVIEKKLIKTINYHVMKDIVIQVKDHFKPKLMLLLCETACNGSHNSILIKKMAF
jgi:hypothetical protein